MVAPTFGISPEYIYTTNPFTNIPQTITGLWYISAGISPTDFYLNITNDNSVFDAIIPPNNEWNRIGTDCHKSGVVAITANLRQENEPSQGLNQSNIAVKDIQYYYRYVFADESTSEWELIPRTVEYNKSVVQTPRWNAPQYLLPNGPTGSQSSWATLSNEQIGGQETHKSVQTLRCFDYLAVTENSNAVGIEYVFIIKEFKQTTGDTTSYPGIGWMNCADLHYPKCVPWQGVNIAPDQTWGDNNEYQYFRSAPGSDSVNEEPMTTNVLYAETPYAEYVNQFFTDTQMQVPYVPPAETPYIGVQLNRAYVDLPVAPSNLTDWKGVDLLEATFSLELDQSGVRVTNPIQARVNTGATFINYQGAEPTGAQESGFNRIKTPV